MFGTLNPPPKVAAGEAVSVTLRYTHEGPPLPRGGRLRIGYGDKDGAGTLQIDDPAKPHFMGVSVRGEARLGVDCAIRRYRSITFFPGAGQSDLVVVSLAIEDGALKAGDTVDLTLGHPENGPGRFVVGNFADTPLTFFYHLDPDNRFAPKGLHPNAPKYEQFISADGCSYPAWRSTGVALPVVPAAPEWADLALPSVVRVGADVLMRIVVYDRYGNHIRHYRDQLQPPSNGAILCRPTALDTGADGVAAVPIRFLRPGIVAGQAFTLRALGALAPNPVQVVEAGSVSTDAREASRLFWGELHGHSALSDGGNRDADFFFRYARTVRGLDFAALADHAFGLAVRGHWNKLRDAVKRHHAEEAFVTLLGYEMMNSYDRKPCGLGHRNLYFPDTEGRLIMADYQPGSGGSFVGEALAAYREIWDQDIPRASTIEAFFEAMRDVAFLWTAHHCGHIDAVERSRLRLYEACSEWGRSEDGLAERNRSTMPLQQVFGDGHNPGLFGNSDNHTAKAGSVRTGKPDKALRHPSGLTALFAPALTRDAVYRNLERKQCYATTGARILLLPEVEREASVLRVSLTMAGTDRLDRITVFKNGREVASESLGADWVREWTWRDAAFDGTDTCFIRLRQADNQMAWINPLPFA